jgi:hypothetical protein
MDNNRKTEFVSELLLGRVINRRNHISYLFLHFGTVSCCLYAIVSVSITSHLVAFITLVVFVAAAAYSVHFGVQIYGICRNLTYDELFYSHKWNHLWGKIRFIE